MISFKPGVSIRGLRTEMVPVLLNLGQWSSVVITSGTDGDHGEKSFHYNGLALDVRTHSFPQSVKESLIKTMKDILGDQYDVVFEDAGGSNEHLHLEYDDGKEAPRVKEDRV